MMVSAMRRSVKIKSERPSFEKIADLTEREREVFMLICTELSLREIGARLSVAEKTIYAHKANILQKLGLKNTVGMIKYAFDNGILS
jgi:DNA-binding CsgD family transcriptional regulator